MCFHVNGILQMVIIAMIIIIMVINCNYSYWVKWMATVTWKDNVVILGGLDNQDNILNTVILYNVTTGNHRMLPEMTTKRWGCTAVIIGDNIIVMGGQDETETDLKSVECFNFNANTWTEFSAMTEARWDATAVVKYD